MLQDSLCGESVVTSMYIYIHRRRSRGAGGAIAPPLLKVGGRKYLSAPPGLGSKNPFFNDATGYSPVECQKFSLAPTALALHILTSCLKSRKLVNFSTFWVIRSHVLTVLSQIA